MFLERINQALWSLCFLPLFVLCGLFLLPLLFSLLHRRRDNDNTVLPPSKGPSPGQAAGTVLAASVGIGNIVGTAQAIAMGGPGAVFWMWAAALAGIPIKVAEIYYGQRRGKGAMGYISSELGRRSAFFFAALASLSALLMGDMAQMSASVSAVVSIAPGRENCLRLSAALLFPLLAGIILRGGSGRIGKVCAALVPLMAGAYALAAGGILFCYRDRVIPALRLILNSAFSPSAALGAGSGAALRQTLLWGLRRGSFSNEAGLGCAANVHACVSATSPERHALWGILEVSVDTLLICSLSALALLSAPISIPYGTLPGPELMQRVFAGVYGRVPAAGFLTLSLAAFGISTVLGAFVSASRCAEWIGWGRRPYLCVYLLCAALGCLFPAEWIWRSADAVNVLMALPNLLALFLLAPIREKPGPARARDFQKFKESGLAAGNRKV